MFCGSPHTSVWFSSTKHWLQLEEGWLILSRANHRSKWSELLRQASEADLHHFVLLDGHIDGGKTVTDVFDPGRVISHRHVSLLHIVHLLSKLNLSGYGACREYLQMFNPHTLIPWRNYREEVNHRSQPSHPDRNMIHKEWNTQSESNSIKKFNVLSERFYTSP